MIGEPDLADVAAFLDRQRAPDVDMQAARSSFPLRTERRLRWLLLDNPARRDDVPLGWLIRDEAGGTGSRGVGGRGGGGDSIVGVMLCVPLRVGAAGGSFAHTALMSCKFFVDEPYRGLGLGLFMRFLKLGGRFPLLATSANAASGALFAQFGGYPIPGTGHTMLGVRRPAPLAEEWARRRGVWPGAARALALPLRLVARRVARPLKGDVSGELIPLHGAQELAAFDLPAPRDAVTVVRDAPHLRWRHFSGDAAAAAPPRVFRFRFPGEPDRLVVADTFRAGHRAQVRVLNIADVWPPATPAAVRAMIAGLAAHYEPSFDVVWLRGQPPETESSLAAAGWVRHAFPAPLGWCIDRAGVLPSREWYLMPGQSE